MMDPYKKRGEGMKRVLWILTAAVLMLLVFFASEIFLIGYPSDPSTLYCNVEETDNQLTIRISTSESAAAFTDAQYQQQGTRMDITFQRVLVSPLHSSGEKCLYLEKGNLTEVYVCGNLVWSTS